MGVRALTAVALVVLACASSVKTAPAPVRAASSDSTFYDFYIERYLRSEPSAVFAADRGALRALSPAETSQFNWSAMGKDHAVYQETQTLRFVLPWLATSEHRDEARSWLISWYNEHCLDESVRISWGSDLATAQRALVFAYWLNQEERRGAQADGAIVEVLRDALRLHQQYLLKNENFDGTMNAGVLQAIALHESARVTGAKDAIAVATRRLLATLESILSPQGASLEHSAQYHFIVLGWTEAALSLYEWLGDDATGALRASVHRMRRAGYFLVDPSDRIVQIGDSDSTVVPGFTREVAQEMGDPGVTFFDSIAGYAIFKSRPQSNDARYAVFRIQPAVTHPEHGHADAMSLVIASSGETILGDSGRYRYASDGVYFASPPAHNSIFPETFLRSNPRRMLSSVTASSRRFEKDGVSWWAGMDWNGITATRRVTVSMVSPVVTVVDTLRPGASNTRPPVFCWTWNAGNDVRNAVLDPADGNEVSWVVETHQKQRFRFHATVSGGAAHPDVQIVTGSYRPFLGWTSPAYGVKRPSWVVLMRVRPGPSMTTVQTVIEPERGR